MNKKSSMADLMQTTHVPDADIIKAESGVHAIVRESQVDILLMLGEREYAEQSDQERAFIRVKVWSVIRPELCSFSDIRCKGKNRDEMARAIEFAAPALGERQELLYGDKHELSRLSVSAKKHYLDLCEELSKPR